VQVLQVSRRWVVERKDGDFEDCGYDALTVLPDGSLRMYNGSIFDPGESYYIAAGQWVTVLEERDQ
jgi:hypothetical protein